MAKACVVHKKKQIGSKKVRICFVTEVDLDRESAGGIVDDLKMLSCLRELGNVDLIYLQRTKCKSVWLALLFFALKIIKSVATPYSVYISRGLITASLLMPFKTLQRKKIVHKTPIPFPSNEVEYLRFGGFESLIRYCLFRFMEKVVLSRVDAIIVPSINYSEMLVRYGVEKNKVYVIPYYVEDDFFKQPIKHDVNDIFTVCYVGSFQLYHDLSSLISAFKIVSQTNPEVKLVMIGDGALRPEIEEKVVEEKLENKIKFLGRFPHSSIPSLLSRMDSYIYLARTTGMSTSLLEAAAAGKPIITLRKKADKSLIQFFRHGKEIYMVNSLSPEEIAEAITLFCTDSELRGSLAEGARKIALKYFNREATLSKLDELFSKI